MDKDTCINKVLRDIRMDGIVDEIGAARLRPHMEILASAVYDIMRKDFASRNKRKIIHYNITGEKLGEYNSIREAAVAAGYKDRYRGGDYIIANVLAGRHPWSKEGYIWRYADDEIISGSNI